MPWNIRVRLSGMMFLQYFVMGSTLPIMGLYLKAYLNFTPSQIGAVLAMPSIAAMISPFFVARIADRVLSAERMLAMCHLVAALVMAVLSTQDQFWPFLFNYLIYGMLIIPTLALTNAVGFHHVTNARRDFGKIRMWGTIGWIAVAWAFGYFWVGMAGDAQASGRLGGALPVSAAASLALGLYALCLPQTRDASPPAKASGGVMRVLSRPSIRLLCVLTFLMSVLNQYYMQWMSPYLSQIGFADKHIMPALSLGQVFEIGAMAFLGAFLARLGMKRVLGIGIALQVIRFVVFANTESYPFVLAAISLHGVSFAFYAVSAYIYLDNHCGPHERSGAQQLYNIANAGVGQMAGSLAAGYTGDWCTVAGTSAIAFGWFWQVPALIAAVSLGIFLLWFKEEEAEASG